jgi:hypothetical protein
MAQQSPASGKQVPKGKIQETPLQASNTCVLRLRATLETELYSLEKSIICNYFLQMFTTATAKNFPVIIRWFWLSIVFKLVLFELLY